MKAVDYMNVEAQKSNGRVFLCNILAVVILLSCVVLRDTDLYISNSFVHVITSVLEGFGIGIIIAGLLLTSRYGARIRAFKKRLLNK